VLDGNKGLFINNADWLRNINYVDFLRDIGKHFSVNRMLSFETYREKYRDHGLSFLEFNYVLLQSYDFLMLYKNHNCTLQIGGDDQWANMLSGVELIRRVTGISESAECLTLPLILTSDGKKMGKTQNGAIFLSKDITNVYDFYQYWINVTDNDVIRFLKLYTFIDDSEIEKLSSLKEEELIEAKKILAFEVTKNVHSESEAIGARESSLAAFGSTSNIELIPKFLMAKGRIDGGLSVLDLFVESGLVESKSEVRRLIKQQGIKVNEERVTDENLIIDSSFVSDGGIILRSGKKKVKRVEIN
jgi:tyrosyl-tRNA synthetase